MIQALRDIQKKRGAIFDEESSTPSSFSSNDREAIEAAKAGVALWDRSSWGLLQLKGEDRSRFLHNQTTNNINSLQPGQGCDTVFVNSTGRTLDLATAYLTEDAILILVSPNRRGQLMQWMDRYIFPMDKVELADISDDNAMFALIGPESDSLVKQLAGDSIVGQPEGSHLLVQMGDNSIRIAVGSGLALPGYTLIVPVEAAAQIWSKLTQLGAIPLGDRVWEQLRILQGRPVPDKELTEDYNPLEAGLWKAISFDKGCYIGQETIARLNTYKGVKQRLWGVKLNAPVAVGTPVTVAGDKVGVLTSYTQSDTGSFGLAYVRTKAGGEGLTVEVGEASGELVGVPFLTHEYYQPQKDNL
ncbi:folate-binding protein YgfZ [Pleurocapsa sp. PCC 7327]|uniref:CAF17-like 4Fe-4S cluster assembly/insertion protein YgfZ n=1 Tax=Pleurocapsa sp. PCC 7327 TaxID=118163 RepID=UPI00029FBA28|nr:folate-binding protein YgfZ [Pleurocapsa sp. PCC 7327]AFY76839.1 folate-binding protein YgfZ [Pleurocapsa sp. PCC 7327]